MRARERERETNSKTKGVIERETERVNSPRIITGADM